MLPRAPEVTLTAEEPAVAASTPQLIPKIYHPVGCNRSPRWAYACRDRPSELRRCPENPPNSLPDLWSSQVCAHRLRHRAGAEVAPRSRTSKHQERPLLRHKRTCVERGEVHGKVVGRSPVMRTLSPYQ